MRPPNTPRQNSCHGPLITEQRRRKLSSIGGGGGLSVGLLFNLVCAQNP